MIYRYNIKSITIKATAIKIDGYQALIVINITLTYINIKTIDYIIKIEVPRIGYLIISSIKTITYTQIGALVIINKSKR